MQFELLDLPRAQRRRIYALALDIADRASSFGPERWGLTYLDGWGIRVNVGWTEILTATRERLRLIVDGRLAATVAPRLELSLGTDPRGFYPSVPGSALLDLPADGGSHLWHDLRSLTPALNHAIELAARRRVGRGVRAGHNHWAVEQLAAALARPVPTAGYESPRASGSRSPEEALSRMEGALTRVVASRYERNPVLRRACVEHYGASCSVCSFSFPDFFGSIGIGFIHVHHLRSISASGMVKVDPIRDLRPVCPNCHAMLHREEPPLAIQELRSIVRRTRPRGVLVAPAPSKPNPGLQRTHFVRR